jgi:hypothetical protein
MEMLVPIFLFLCIAGVLILRPISKKLGLLIEALAKERLAGTGAGPTSHASAGLDAAHIERVTIALEQLNNRLDLVDDRIAFMERLVESRPTHRLTG